MPDFTFVPGKFFLILKNCSSFFGAKQTLKDKIIEFISHSLHSLRENAERLHTITYKLYKINTLTLKLSSQILKEPWWKYIFYRFKHYKMYESMVENLKTYET